MRFWMMAVAVGVAACGRPAERPSADWDAERVERVTAGLRPALAIAGEPEARWTLSERMAHHRVPAVSIAVIDGNRIVWAAGIGLREAGSTDSVDAETLFQAGSISKPVFAVAVMRLVQSGVLNLDRNVNEVLTSWKVPENRFLATGKVTLRRLLSHTAGLTVHGFPGYPAGTPVPTIPQVLDGAPPANTGPVRADTFPGAISRYSGGGTTVAQLAATDVTGRPFPELMKEQVLGPVGMTRSTYQQPLPAALAPNTASGHRGDGSVVPGKYHTYPEMAAAGLWTTASDLARLAIELQLTHSGRSTRLMTRATLDTMFTVQPPAKGSGFGIGFHIDGSGPDLEFSHGGADEGFRAQFVAFAERGQGAFVMTNGDNGDRLADEILASIAAELDWPTHHPRKKAVVKLDAAAMEAVAGKYALIAGGAQSLTAIVSLEGGSLFLEVPDAGLVRTELLAESPTTFFTRESGYGVELTRDERGRLSLTIDGSISGRKIE